MNDAPQHETWSQPGVFRYLQSVLHSSMIITEEWLEEFATKGIGFSRAQMIAIGAPWPLRRGWKGRLVGREITDDQRRRYEALAKPREPDAVGHLRSILREDA